VRNKSDLKRLRSLIIGFNWTSLLVLIRYFDSINSLIAFESDFQGVVAHSIRAVDPEQIKELILGAKV
jgi:hypothetical protein